MAWLILILAGLLETGWALGLKLSQGFTRPLTSILTLLALAASMILLERAVRVLPVGTAYAVWTGIGTVGTAALAVVLFGEPVTAARLAGIGLIVAGIVLLRFA